MPLTVNADTSQWTMAGVWVAAIGLVGLLIRSVGPWRKQISDMEERLREELKSELDAERTAHKDAINRIVKLERAIKRRDRVREAERAMERHRFNNLDQCFNALLLLLKANPDKVPEAISMIEEMRASQLVAEAEEKAIIRAAAIESAAATEAEAEGPEE